MGPKLSWLLAGVLAAVVLFAMPAPPGLSIAGQRALVITILAALLWTTEALPLPATGLGCVALLVVTGATPSMAEALSGFAQPVPYFLYGVLVLGLAAGKSGLAERVARGFLSLARGRPTFLYWQLIWSFAALAFVLPSASTRVGVQVPIYHEALLLLKAGPGSRVGKAVMQALAQLNRMGSNALLTGGITPVTAAALLGGLGWGQWFLLMSVPVYAILAVGAVAVQLMYHPFEAAQSPDFLAGLRLDRKEEEEGSLGTPQTPTEGACLNAACPRSALCTPPPGRGTPQTPPAHHSSLISHASELRVCAILLGVSVLWLTDSWHHLDPAVPALFGAVLVVSPGIGVLTWAEVERGVGVSMVFVVAASLSLAHAVVASGGSTWLGAWLLVALQPFAETTPLLIALLLAVSLVARALLTSITAYLTVLIPVVAALAEAVDLNPLTCGLLVTLVGDSVVYYAAQSSSSLMPFEYGYLSAGEVLRFGLVMTVVAVLVGLFVALPYWAWLGQPLSSLR